MKVLMLSIDKKIFENGSDVRNRMIEYGSLFDELHIVVQTPKGFSNSKISFNVFLYPTNTAFKPLYFSDAYKICKKIIKEYSIDIITSQDAFTNLVAIKLRRRFKNIKFQVQIHTDFFVEKFKKQSLKNFFRYLLYVSGVKSADCIRVVSESMKNNIIERFNVSASKISVLPIFIDVEKIKTAPVSVDLHKKYPQFEKIILMVSRLEREKNIPLALSAMKDVVAGYPKAGLVVVGDGSQKKKLKSLTNRYSLDSSIVYDGWKDKETIYSYYKTADVFLVTSDYEGYGLTIIESLASGLPVIATDVGVAREAGAQIVDRNNLSQSIIRYIEDGQKTAKLVDYPYRNKTEYLEKFKKSFICAS